jgi:hypothetical protein
MSQRVSNWIELYRTAWESNEPNDIRALFTEDAEYRTEPYAQPWEGHAAIVEGWLEAADEPGETTFEWATVIENDELGIVQARTQYSDGPTYSNLWVIHFAPDGRAAAFTEWWMDQASRG